MMNLLLQASWKQGRRGAASSLLSEKGGEVLGVIAKLGNFIHSRSTLRAFQLQIGES